MIKTIKPSRVWCTFGHALQKPGGMHIEVVRGSMRWRCSACYPTDRPGAPIPGRKKADACRVCGTPYEVRQGALHRHCSPCNARRWQEWRDREGITAAREQWKADRPAPADRGSKVQRFIEWRKRQKGEG